MKALSVVHPKTEFAPPVLPTGSAERPYRFAPDLDTPRGQIEAAVVAALKRIRDPEIPVNIFELGLIYGVEVHDDHGVTVRMTLTAPNCPVAQSMPEEVRQQAAAAAGVTHAEVSVVWEPPWNRGMMSEAARLELNL